MYKLLIHTAFPRLKFCICLWNKPYWKLITSAKPSGIGQHNHHQSWILFLKDKWHSNHSLFLIRKLLYFLFVINFWKIINKSNRKFKSYKDIIWWREFAFYSELLTSLFLFLEPTTVTSLCSRDWNILMRILLIFHSVSYNLTSYYFTLCF